MSEASDAAEQVVKMMLSGSEVAVRLGGSALKNGAALLLALAKNHKKVFGKINLRPLRRDFKEDPLAAQFGNNAVHVQKLLLSRSALYPE